jgi:hypothetical protein
MSGSRQSAHPPLAPSSSHQHAVTPAYPLPQALEVDLPHSGLPHLAAASKKDSNFFRGASCLVETAGKS